MSTTVVTLSDPGEGLTEAEIVAWKVAVGDRVEINQILVEVETEKSVVELPSPHAGTVARLLAAEGDEVAVGAPILELAGDGADDAPGSDPEEPARSAEAAAPAAAEPATAPGADTDSEPAEDAEPPSLVGYGTAASSSRRRPRRTDGAVTDVGAPRRDDTPQYPAERALAKPPVRKLAKDLGIALADVLATGPGGTVTRDDVLGAAHGDASGDAGPAADDGANWFPDEPQQAPAGLGSAMKSTRHQAFPGVTSDDRTTRVPIRSVRRRTAEAMVSSAFTAPHVTVFNTIDMSASMRLVRDLRASREWRDVRVSPLLIIMKAVLVAIRRNPEVNAAWDEEAREIVYKHYVNLGIAAATPRGLIVPNIKDAHVKTLRELADDLNDLTSTARDGRTAVSATRDGTVTITNYGVFGIDSGTPILNPGEAVIIGFGGVEPKPWVVDGELTVREVTTLSISFDHRLIDGGLGAKFLADVSAVLERPEVGLVWG